MLFLDAAVPAIVTAILNLLNYAGQGITAWLTIFTGAIKSALLNLIYEDPTAATPEVSGLMVYLFIFFGVNVVVGIVWFILSLAKRRGR